MRILMVLFYAATPTPVYPQLAKKLRSLGHEVWLGTPNVAGDMTWHDGSKAVGVQRNPWNVPEKIAAIPLLGRTIRWLRDATFLLRIRRFIASACADVVQLDPPYRCTWLLTLFQPRRTLFVFDLHQVTGLRGGVRTLKYLVGIKVTARFFFDHACFMSESAAHRVLGPRWERWATVHPVGVDSRFLRYQWRNGCAPRVGAVRFIYVGALSRYRKLEYLLKAAYLLSQRTKDFTLTLVGPDDTNGYHHRLIQEMSLEDRVAIKPPIPYGDVPDLLATADVALAYVPPLADWKLQPTLKVLEYRAIGIPIIASDNAPNREVVESNLNGLLVEDSEQDLAAAMERFVADRKFLEACCDRARAMRRGKTWTEVASSYENAFYSKIRAPRRRFV